MNAEPHWAIRSFVRGIAAPLFVVTAPVAVLHELSHAVCAWPWARELYVELKPAVVTTVEWREGAPWWAVALGHYGPFVAGLVLAVVALAVVLVGAVDVGDVGPYQGVAVAAAWLVLMYPNHRDRDLPGRGEVS